MKVNSFWALLTIIFFVITFFLVAEGQDNLWPFFSWLVSLMALLLSFRHFWPRRVSFSLKKDWFLPWLILIIYTLRLLWMLNPQGLFLHGDEALVSRNAQQAFELGLSKGEWNLLGAKWGTLNLFPALWYYLQGGMIKILGPSVTSIKLLSLVTDIGIAVLVYLLAAWWFGKRMAVVSFLLYSTLPIVIHFGASGYQNIQSTFFLLLTLSFLVRGEKAVKAGEGDICFLWAGMAAGLGMYFYLSSVLTPIIGGLFIFFWFAGHWQFLIKRSFLFFLGWLTAAGPYLSYSFSEYNFALGRSSVFNFWQESSLVTKNLVSQICRVVLGLFIWPFNGSGRHYLDLPAIPHLLASLLFLVGLSLVLVNFKKKNQGFFEIVIIFLMTLLLGGVLTESSPAPQRLIHLFPMIGLIMAIGVQQVSKLSLFLTKNSFYPQLFFWSLALICLAGNLFSFYRENLPRYRSSLKEEYSFSRFFIENDFQLPLLTHIPSHRREMIYFYSSGLISPLVADRVNFSNQLKSSFPEPDRTFFYLTDQAGVELLKDDSLLQKRPVVWPNAIGLELFEIRPRQ